MRPRSALMVDHDGTIQAVALEYMDEKKALGWFLVASDADVLPFNGPRLVMPQADGDGGDGA